MSLDEIIITIKNMPEYQRTKIESIILYINGGINKIIQRIKKLISNPLYYYSAYKELNNSSNKRFFVVWSVLLWKNNIRICYRWSI